MDYKLLLEELLKLLSEGVYIVDANGVGLEYNQAMADIEKIKIEDVVGREYTKAFPGVPPAESTLFRALKRGEETRDQQQTYLNLYGKEVTTINRTSPVWRDGKIVAAIEVASDITALRDMSYTIQDLRSKGVTTGGSSDATGGVTTGGSNDATGGSSGATGGSSDATGGSSDATGGSSGASAIPGGAGDAPSSAGIAPSGAGIAPSSAGIAPSSAGIAPSSASVPRRKGGALKKYTFDDLVGENPAFRATVEKARKAATNNASVFIYGETGTGKELFAQSIHYESARRGRPFIGQNCAALPQTLLEGILFGTSKGGFTGAVDRAGLFEQANGGTLLLDEISAMPYELQSKLLRVLQEDYIRRVGGTQDIPVDVRIIATVNEDPQKLIREGALRKDLYYRLNVVNLSVPPLRERKDDIPLLVKRFLSNSNQRFGKEIWLASDGALNTLNNYDYPGNVRELENIIIQAVALAGDEHVLDEHALQMPIHAEISRQDIEGWNMKDSLPDYLENLERELLREALLRDGWNISKAAASLGIKRQTLQHKMKKFGFKEA